MLSRYRCQHRSECNGRSGYHKTSRSSAKSNFRNQPASSDLARLNTRSLNSQSEQSTERHGLYTGSSRPGRLGAGTRQVCFGRSIGKRLWRVSRRNGLREDFVKPVRRTGACTRAVFWRTGRYFQTTPHAGEQRRRSANPYDQSETTPLYSSYQLTPISPPTKLVNQKMCPIGPSRWPHQHQ